MLTKSEEEANQQTKNTIIWGIRVYERGEKSDGWHADSDDFPFLLEEGSFHYFCDLDDFPEDSYECWVLPDGKVFFKRYDCYPEYTAVGFPVEVLGVTDYRMECYYQNEYTYCKETNDLSWAYLYDSLEDFWKDSLVNALEILSCKLEKKIYGLYHLELSRYCLHSPKITWYLVGDRKTKSPPEGYQHWIRLIYGYHPDSTDNKWWDIFYPLKPRSKQRITITAHSNLDIVNFDWNHGKHGLTKHILDALFENIQPSNNDATPQNHLPIL